MELLEVQRILEELRKHSTEDECYELKEAKLSFDFEKLGKYFSALANEANLKNKEYAWLVFGIKDNGEIVGTHYREKRKDLNNLKYEIFKGTTNHTFEGIYEIKYPEGRVLVFQIPPAPRGVPIFWKGHYYGRHGESLSALSLSELEKIRHQIVQSDWSAGVCPEASIADLDSLAIKKAREEFGRKHPHLQDQIEIWDDVTFLNKAKVLVKGHITRSAILLLGKPESIYHIQPSVAQMTWILRDTNSDYEHFGPPFILNTEAVFHKIRNLKYRYIANDSLFPTEIMKYDAYVIREALHNCIAHQDYSLNQRINIIEMPDMLILENAGSFLPETIDAVINENSPQSYYRNHWLVSAMVNFNMIDTIGSGIRKMFSKQRERFFPLPDYDLSNPQKVKVTIYGKVLDENYTRMLIQNTELALHDVILLDRIQKKERISRAEAKHLRNIKLIEGRFPNIYISAQVAKVTGEKSKYIHNKALDDKFYKELVIELLKKYKSASRKDINDLLLSKLSTSLTEKQKENKIRNLLYQMSRIDKTLINKGSKRFPKWFLEK